MADPQDEIARDVAARPGWFRTASKYAILATLGASALAPLIVAGGPAALAATAAGIAGNVGAGYVTEIVARLADRSGGRTGDGDSVRDELERALLDALTAGRAESTRLADELLTVVDGVDGIRSALEAADDDLRARLGEVFTELSAHNAHVRRRLDDVFGKLSEHDTYVRHRLDALGDDMRGLTREVRRKRTAEEERADRLRYQQTRPPEQATPTVPPVVRPLATPTGAPTGPRVETWAGGAEVDVGPDTYLLYDAHLGERYSDDHGTLRRWARGQRIVPAPGAGEGYVWLRRVETGRDAAAGRAAVAALAGERALLERLKVRGAPRLVRYAADDRGATLATAWPGSRSRQRPCDTLIGLLDSGRHTSGPLDAVRTAQLLTGVAGLCRTLAALHRLDRAHRSLTPDVLIALDNGQLVLRDLGLAAVPPAPGEGPDDYRAPEQTLRNPGLPGPPADVYQTAALTYHLITGELPYARMPLPIRHFAPDVPEPAARALDAALAPDPAARPDAAALATALRATS